MPEGTEYILKNKEKIKAIGVGKAKISIGNKNNKLTVCDREQNTKSKKQGLYVYVTAGNIR